MEVVPALKGRPKVTRRYATRRRRIDTPIEIDYYLHGGILPYVLRQLLAGTTGF